MRLVLICLTLVLAAPLTGCVGLTVGSATLVVKAAPRDELQPLAEAGDAAAQYELGKSFCCMGVGFSTQTATEWLCKAAHQGNADAMYELGRIYLGQISRSVAPGQRVRGALMAKEFPAHAHLWLSLASSVDFSEASKLLDDLSDDISDADRAHSAEMQISWREAPCEYESVLSSVEA